MAYSEELASRIRAALAHREAVTEKRMFGGLTFLVGGRMSCGVLRDDLVLRVSGQDYEEALAHPHARPMDFTGEPMKGFLYIGLEGYQRQEDLQRWLAQALAYVDAAPPKRTSRRPARKSPGGIAPRPT
ncbi:MAG: TfoX/Sxy family protein [Chloroflexi bacterium]|nr:TfoX/Sxy family protein [Chloroflexota bacterium]